MGFHLKGEKISTLTKKKSNPAHALHKIKDEIQFNLGTKRK